jgi:hypothetical protein
MEVEASRRHPDLFNGREAFAYLFGPAEEYRERTMDTLRSKGLHAVKLTNFYQYHRRDLDALVDREFGAKARETGKQLTMSSRRAG